jgi:hypothetical protein
MGPRARLDGCGKSRPPPGFDPRTVQPVASRYPVPHIYIKGLLKAWLKSRMRYASATGTAGALRVKHNIYVVDLHAKVAVKTVL